MTDEELVARLEAWEPLVSSGHIVSRAGQDLRQAADRIEALTAALIKIREHNNTYGGSSYILRIIEEALEKQP
jgi:hypothetical protein